MKILFCHKDITFKGPAGGLSTLYVNLTKHFIKMNHEVAIVTSRNEKWDVPAERFIVSKDFKERDQQISEIVEKWNPDIIECPSWGAEMLEYSKCKNGVPIVMRGDIPANYYSLMEKFKKEEMLAQNVAEIIAISNWCALEWSSISGRVHPVVSHGSLQPTTKITEKDKEKNLVVWVGKATRMKGIDLLLKIAPKITNTHQLICIIAPTKNEDKSIILNLERSGAKILRNLSDSEYFNLLKKSTYALSTARKEGFCIAILEAMNFGSIPIVPRWVGGTLDFVNNNTGLCYQDISEIPKLLRDTNRRDELLNNAKRQGALYTWEKTAYDTLEIYQRVIKEKREERKYGI